MVAYGEREQLLAQCIQVPTEHSALHSLKLCHLQLMLRTSLWINYHYNYNTVLFTKETQFTSFFVIESALM